MLYIRCTHMRASVCTVCTSVCAVVHVRACVPVCLSGHERVRACVDVSAREFARARMCRREWLAPVHACLREYVRVNVRVSVRLCARLYVCVHTCANMRVHVCTCAFVSTCHVTTCTRWQPERTKSNTSNFVMLKTVREKSEFLLRHGVSVCLHVCLHGTYTLSHKKRPSQQA